MGKKVYLGVSGKARKVKKMYIGVSGKARKVKKGYIGVGGKARPFWSGGELEYYGNIANLASARYSACGLSFYDYAIFAGGCMYNSNNGSYRAAQTVDCYNRSLVKSSISALTSARFSACAATTPNYGIVAGGEITSTSGGSEYSAEAYSKSLVKTQISNVSRKRAAAASVGNYAVFAGGYGGNTSLDTAKSVNDALTLTTITSLASKRDNLCGGNLPGYAVFAGGQYSQTGKYSSGRSTVDAYDSSLTRTTATALSSARANAATASVGEYLLIAGGATLNSTGRITRTRTVDTYLNSLTRGTATNLSAAKRELIGLSLDGFAIFTGGDEVESSNVTDVYNEQLVRTTGPAFVTPRRDAAGAVAGSYGLIAGGYTTTYSNVVEAYTV